MFVKAFILLVCLYGHQVVSATTSQIPVRLIGMLRTNTGVAQVYINNTWSNVCRTGYMTRRIQEATVICRMLGYNGGGQLRNDVPVSTAQGYPTLLTNVKCLGNESSILDCFHDVIGSGHCGVGLASVYCMSGSDIRLRNGSRASQGRLEVFYKGEWGAVCDNSFDNKDATVVCRALGYSGNFSRARLNSFYGSGPAHTWISDVYCYGNESSLFMCQSSQWGGGSCSGGRQAGVDCQTYLEAKAPVRLVGGNFSYEGRVQVLHNGQWETVCNNNFDENAALVVCNQLNITNALVIPLSSTTFSYGGTGPIWLDKVICSGKENDLGECQRQPWGQTSCQHYNDASVMCVPLADQKRLVRLRGGKRHSQGRLEVFYDQWGTVCDEHRKFDDRAASVVCRMLGFTGRFAVARYNNFYGYGSGSTLYTDISCTGNETSLFSCNNSRGRNTCYQHHDVGVDCEPYEEVYLGARLVNGPSSREGRIEVNYNGTWGTVCDNSWGVHEATVACRQLGYSRTMAVPVSGAHYGPGTGPIHLDGLKCNGSETNLGWCQKKPLDVNTCNHQNDAGIICLPHEPVPPRNISLRLADGKNPSQGRVEIEYRGIWGTICGSSWNNKNAAIICRQLGYSWGVILLHVTPGHGPIWMDGVACSGLETNIADCPFNGWGNNTCDHSVDAGVLCENNGGAIVG